MRLCGINLARNLLQILIMKDEIFSGINLTNWKIWKMLVWEINQIKILRNIFLFFFLLFYYQVLSSRYCRWMGVKGRWLWPRPPTPTSTLTLFPAIFRSPRNWTRIKMTMVSRWCPTSSYRSCVCRPDQRERWEIVTWKVKNIYLKGEKNLSERWQIYTWKVRTIYMKSENYFHERCIIFTLQVRFLCIHIVRVQCHLHFYFF